MQVKRNVLQLTMGDLWIERRRRHARVSEQRLTTEVSRSHSTNEAMET